MRALGLHPRAVHTVGMPLRIKGFMHCATDARTLAVLALHAKRHLLRGCQRMKPFMFQLPVL